MPHREEEGPTQFTVVRKDDQFTPQVESMDLEAAQEVQQDLGDDFKVAFADQVAWNELGTY